MSSLKKAKADTYEVAGTTTDIEKARKNRLAGKTATDVLLKSTKEDVYLAKGLYKAGLIGGDKLLRKAGRLARKFGGLKPGESAEGKGYKVTADEGGFRAVVDDSKWKANPDQSPREQQIERAMFTILKRVTLHRGAEEEDEVRKSLRRLQPGQLLFVGGKRIVIEADKTGFEVEFKDEKRTGTD